MLITWDHTFFFLFFKNKDEFYPCFNAIWWSVTKRKSVTYQLIPKVSKTSAVDAAAEYISSFALPTASLRSRREWVPARSSVRNARTRVQKAAQVARRMQKVSRAQFIIPFFPFPHFRRQKRTPDRS